MKKYEFTGNEKLVSKRDRQFRLHEIRAVRDIATPGVRAGDVGGWIEDYASLAQTGDCWVGKDTFVYDRSEVVDDALVLGSRIEGRTHIGGNAYVQESYFLGEGSSIVDDAFVRGVTVHGTLHAHNNANFEDCVIFQYVKAMGENIVVYTSNFYGENRLSQNTRIEKSNIHNVQFRLGAHRIIGSSIESTSVTDLIGDVELEDVQLEALTINLATSEKIVLKHVIAQSLQRIELSGKVLMTGVRVDKGARFDVDESVQLLGNFYPEAKPGEEHGIHITSETFTCGNVLVEGDVRIMGSWSIRRSTISGIIALEAGDSSISILANCNVKDCVSVSVPSTMIGIYIKNRSLQGDECYKTKNELSAIGIPNTF